jgi:hypothetical protein
MLHRLLAGLNPDLTKVGRNWSRSRLCVLPRVSQPQNLVEDASPPWLVRSAGGEFVCGSRFCLTLAFLLEEFRFHGGPPLVKGSGRSGRANRHEGGSIEHAGTAPSVAGVMTHSATATRLQRMGAGALPGGAVEHISHRPAGPDARGVQTASQVNPVTTGVLFRALASKSLNFCCETSSPGLSGSNCPS